MNRKSLYISALVAVAVAGCQDDELVSRHKMNDVTVKYTVALDQQIQTKAAGEMTEQHLVLTDATEYLSIPMSYDVTNGIIGQNNHVEIVNDTKGTLVNTTGNDNKTLSEFAGIVGSFVTKAYDETGSEIVSQTASWSNGVWLATPTAYWPQATNLSFLAYANLPGSQTATITKDGVSTVHTVPASAADQKDILFGHYQGNGGYVGTAEIRFEHPLTAVSFHRGVIDSDFIINSISIEGVAHTGTAAMDVKGAISWSEVGNHDYTVSQTSISGLSVDETSELIGDPFIIIPQDIRDNAVNISVTLTNGSIFSTEINTGEWLSNG